MNKDHIYKSKVDWWLALILIATPVFVVSIGVYQTVTFGSAGLITILIGLFIGILIALLAIPCRYILTDQSLIIQAGILKETLPRSRIKNAILSSDPLSAPALSLKRVKINLDKGYRLVSPIDREAFIHDLLQRNTNTV